MKSQLKAGAVLSYIALFLNSVISIVYTPIMLKLLGQSEYGLYSLAISVAGYVGILNFGLGNAVIRYTAKYKELKDEEGCSRLYGMFFMMYGSLGLAAFISGAILTLNAHNMFAKSLSVEELQTLKILMGIMVLNLSTGIGFGLFSVIILALEKFIFQKVVVILSSIVSPLIMLPLLIMGYGSVAMAIVTTILGLVSIAVNGYYCFKVMRIKIVFGKIQKDLLKEVIIFSFFIFINLIIEKIYWSTDQVILGIYSGTIAISIYTIGATFTGYFSGFSSAISNVFLSKVTGMVTREVPNKEISDLFIRVGRVQYIILSFALSGFIVFGQEFIHLWVGQEYSDSYTIALIILIPSMIALTQSLGGVILQARNLHKFKTMIYLVIAVVKIFLSILFIQRWGAIGCALATGIAFSIGNIGVINIYYKRKLQIDIIKFWKNITMMSTPLAASVAFGATLNKAVIAASWLELFLKIILFSAAYILIIWYVGMNKYEKELVRGPLVRATQKIRKVKLYKMG